MEYGWHPIVRISCQIGVSRSDNLAFTVHSGSPQFGDGLERLALPRHGLAPGTWIASTASVTIQATTQTTTHTTTDSRKWVGRVSLTIAVGVGTFGTILLVSSIVRAIEHIDRTDNTLAELSQFIADGHASVRGHVSTGDSSVKATLAPFEQAVERRTARLQFLNSLLEQQTGASYWTAPLQGNADLRQIEAEQRAYVAAASAMITTPVNDLAMDLRFLDLRARKLMVAVAAVRDHADTARAQALASVEGMVTLATGLGGLLIAYLIWNPVLGGARGRARTIPGEDLIGLPAMAFTPRDKTGWLQVASEHPRR